MPIRQLPLQLANQIAAGEVVERPSSVVKELVENSIDAGATELLIDIEQGGAKRIRIRDNGSGIPKEELDLALSRHATSKIHTLDDLESIVSLGFRGEALASISSVSRLTLTSKPQRQNEAWQAFCEGRDMQVQIQPAAHPAGTTVDVQDLFFNTPARRKFLRTEKTEFSHIDEVLRRIALGAPEVRILLTHNGRKIRDYRPLRNPNASAEKGTERGDMNAASLPRLKAVVGNAFASQAIYLQHEGEPWQLHGWIAAAEHCRHQHDIQYMYVNGRMMKDRLLNHAIRQAYGDTLADDRQPTFVLYLQVPARDVDVNVHPAKHEVRFHQARQVHDFVLQTLRQAFPQSAEQVALTQEVGFQPPPRHAYARPVTYDPAAGASYQSLMTPAVSADEANAVTTREPAYMSEKSAVIHAEPDVAEPHHAQSRQQQVRQEGRNAATDWTFIKLLEQRYGLVHRHTTTTQLALTDITDLQQRVQTQRIATQLEQGLSGQPLLLPVQLSLDAPLSELCLQQLPQLGVQLKLLQSHRAIVMQVPAMLRQRPIAQSVMELITRLTTQPLSEQSSLHAWLASQGAQDVFSEQQAKYWFTEAFGLDQLEPTLRTLDWHSAVSL